MKPKRLNPAKDDAGTPNGDTLEWNGGDTQRERLDKERQLATPDTPLRDATQRRAEEDEP